MATGMGKKHKYTMASLLTEWTNHEGGYLHQKFSILNNRSFDDPSDAEALCAALRNPRADDLDGDPKEFWLNSDPAWYTIAWKMYRASESINMIIRSHGLPQLKRRLELALSETAIWQQQARGEDVTYRFLNGEACHYVFLLSLLVLNQDSDATRLTNLAARHPRFESGGNLARTLANWPGVFSCFPTNRADSLEVLDLLRYPLPKGHAAAGYLLLSNRLIREAPGSIDHPFDSPEGLRLLHQVAFSDEDDGFEVIEDPDAIFVVEALPFIRQHGKEFLVAKLAKHPNKHVRSALRKIM